MYVGSRGTQFTGTGADNWKRCCRVRCLSPASYQSRNTGAASKAALDLPFALNSLDQGSGIQKAACERKAVAMTRLNVGELASINDTDINKIVDSALASFTSDEPVERRHVEFVARMAVAATGGHLAVEDGFFFECQRKIARLPHKKMLRWKAPCSDSSGTRRNVVADCEGTLRVRDDVGRLAPIVPASISQTVNGADNLSSWVEANIPRFLRNRVLEATISEPAPPPKILSQGRPGPTGKRRIC